MEWRIGIHVGDVLVEDDDILGDADLTRLPCTYRQAITLFTEELPWLSVDDQEWVMGRGLCDWLGCPPPG